MRKVLTLALIALAGGAIPVLAAGACEDSQGRSQADPLGACESTSGSVSCSGATAAPAGGIKYYAPSDKGAAVCMDAGPAQGRYGVSNTNGRVSAYADMGAENALAGNGTDWVRGDVNTSNPRICVYRGAEGSAWLSGSGHDPSAEDTGEPVLEPLDDALAPAGGNPAPGVGPDGVSQCFLGFGTPDPGDPPVGVPTGVPSP